VNGLFPEDEMAAEREPTRAELLAELNDLLQLDHDAVQAYTLAIDTLKSDAYRETLIQFRGDHQRHIRELTDLVRAHGGTPVETAHLPTGLFKLAVQALGTAGDDRRVLLAFKTNEGQVREKYRRHADAPHPPEVTDVLRRAAVDEEKHYAWAAEILERLGAGPESTLGQVQEVVEQVHGRTADAVEGAERRVRESLREARRKD
jgi:rubrerythrin